MTPDQHLNEIENKIKLYRNYNDIPKAWIKDVNVHFDFFAYIKSLLDIKREEG